MYIYIYLLPCALAVTTGNIRTGGLWWALSQIPNMSWCDVMTHMSFTVSHFVYIIVSQYSISHSASRTIYATMSYSIYVF